MEGGCVTIVREVECQPPVKGGWVWKGIAYVNEGVIAILLR